MFQLAAWFVQVPAPAGERWNCTVATPEPVSAESLVRAIVPRTSAAAAGPVTVAGGDCVVDADVASTEVNALPALSVVTTRRS